MRRVLLALLFTLVACGDGPLDPGERREIERARALWEQKRPASYTFEARISCFCDPAIAVWTELLVNGDQVMSVRPLQPLPSGLSGSKPEQWHTVNALFTLIEQAGAASFTKDVSASYDPTYGFPTRIQITCVDNVTDCGSTYEARNLQLPRIVR